LKASLGAAKLAAAGWAFGHGAGESWQNVAFAREGQPHEPPLQYAVGMKLIAIIEDEPAIRDNYAAAFTREGYAVRTYGNRRQAMTACAARLPDLAVIDISLQDEPEGGFELCRALRSMSAELPIIFLTARDSDLDAVSGLRLGADDFLT
jgi:CheY-like chemotaxis protein